MTATMTPADRLDLRDLMICTLHDNGYGALVQPSRRVMAAALTDALIEAGWRPPSLTGTDIDDLHRLDGVQR